MLLKKVVMTVAMVMCFAVGAEAKLINTNDLAIAAGQTRECYIYLGNLTSDYVAFQIEVSLPKGLRLNAEHCLLTDRITDDDQALYVGEVGSNVFRLVSASNTLTPLSRADDVFVKLSLTADETFQGGTVNLSNMFLVTSKSVKGNLIADSFKVDVVPYIKGDVNSSQSVEVTDLMLIVNYILTPSGLYSSMMDVDGNGSVDVTDVMTVVNILLGK